jgi:hypothetical protein
MYDILKLIFHRQEQIMMHSFTSADKTDFAQAIPLLDKENFHLNNRIHKNPSWKNKTI